MRELEAKLQEKCSEEKNLLAKVESLKAENDFTKEQLSAIKAKYENIKNGRLSFGAIVGKDLKGDYCIVGFVYKPRICPHQCHTHHKRREGSVGCALEKSKRLHIRSESDHI